jgi:hypothetical protein
VFLRKREEICKYCLKEITVVIILSTSHKILSNILLSRLSPYVDKIIGDNQYEFGHNRSTTDHIFFIHQIMERKKWEHNQTVQ